VAYFGQYRFLGGVFVVNRLVKQFTVLDLIPLQNWMLLALAVIGFGVLACFIPWWCGRGGAARLPLSRFWNVFAINMTTRRLSIRTTLKATQEDFDPVGLFSLRRPAEQRH
jgi:hypothetical protein